jgi:glyoxylase I family protein
LQTHPAKTEWHSILQHYFRCMTTLLQGVHHIAIICSDYAVSKAFYTEALGLEIIREVHRAERESYKLDLAVNGQYVIELFSFPNPPPRPSRPEAQGLRHLAFAVADVEAAIRHLGAHHVACEPVRVDEFTGRRFTFFSDPDGLPLELYEG